MVLMAVHGSGDGGISLTVVVLILVLMVVDRDGEGTDGSERVSVICLTESAPSTTPMAVLLYSPWAAPPSVKVGLSAVAVKAGASLTGVMVTVETMLSVVSSSPPFRTPPVSSISVRVTVRLAPSGSSLLFS